MKVEAAQIQATKAAAARQAGVQRPGRLTMAEIKANRLEHDRQYDRHFEVRPNGRKIRYIRKVV